jgi:hypothetical protein
MGTRDQGPGTRDPERRPDGGLDFIPRGAPRRGAWGTAQKMGIGYWVSGTEDRLFHRPGCTSKGCMRNCAENGYRVPGTRDPGPGTRPERRPDGGRDFHPPGCTTEGCMGNCSENAPERSPTSTRYPIPDTLVAVRGGPIFIARGALRRGAWGTAQKMPPSALRRVPDTRYPIPWWRCEAAPFSSPGVHHGGVHEQLLRKWGPGTRDQGPGIRNGDRTADRAVGPRQV